MQLKSLNLFGFKSFADKTELIIEPGITVVIGPNGCGKSNVVDAIRWVLGEKFARNIRGEKMEDIIFNGTELRKPLSLAEISLVMDNSNRILDFDSETVEVGRRIFRDGESEYLINKSAVRLKDIEKLFMDTGIGKASYSVMEQGKIDMILSTRPEDRRYFFEEAAGISRYKLEKKEAERKLASTSGNLSRINDIIKEIERERDLKSGQAAKTKEYLALRKKLVELDIQLHLIDFFQSDKRRIKLKEDLEVLLKERESISARISKISAEEENDEKKRNDIQTKLYELDKELHTYKIKIEDIENKTEKNRKLIKDEYQRREKIQNQITEKTASLEKITEEKKKNEKIKIDVGKKLEEDSGKLAEQVKLKKEKNNAILKSRENIAENKKLIRLDDDRQKELIKAREDIIRKLLEAIERRKAELAGSEKERQSVKNKIDGSLDILSDRMSKAIKILNENNIPDALELLRSVNVDELRSDIRKFENYEDGFRSILFDKSGIHAEKENLDSKINDTNSRINRLQAEITNLEDLVLNDQVELERISNNIANYEKEIIRNENEGNWLEKHIESLSFQIEELTGYINNYGEERELSEKISRDLLDEITEWGNQIVKYNEKGELLKQSVKQNIEIRTKLEQEIFKRRNISRKDIENQQKIADRIGEKEKLLVEIDIKTRNIEEYLWTEYEKKITDLKDVKFNEAERSAIFSNIQELKRKINDLGPINNLAIEEYKELTQRHEYYARQRDDIDKARIDILSIIEDIDKTSIELFLETLQVINSNFSEVFSKLFEGGTATIELTDPENVLESGIDIIARPPGKKLKSISIMSGGEKTLTAIALLFAAYMVRPSPFCFLDEIDAALDEENINRFTRILQQFSKTTQFIIISHNKRTISIGDSIYGITMEEPGISKVVSYRLSKKAG